MMATKAAASKVSVWYRPMKPPCAAEVFPYPSKHKLYLLFVGRVSCLIHHNCKEYSTLDLFNNVMQDLLRHDGRQLILHFM